MDVNAPPRPHSNQRPTQQYYVPRRLLECGRGNTQTSPPPPSQQPIEKPNKKAAKARVNPAPAKTSKPRPLMEQILAPPVGLKEKRSNNQRQQKNETTNRQNKKAAATSSKPNRQKVVAAASHPRDLHIPSSTPSSRSSSSMSSSQQLSPTVTATAASVVSNVARNVVAPSLTTSSPRVLHVKGRPQKYSLQRPNAFSPTVSQSSENDECICDRKNNHVICKRCSYECIGRVQITCGHHPMVLALNDFRECPNPVCRSIQIIELECTGNVHDEHLLDQLSEPIQKIDLLAIDED